MLRGKESASALRGFLLLHEAQCGCFYLKLINVIGTEDGDRGAAGFCRTNLDGGSGHGGVPGTAASVLGDKHGVPGHPLSTTPTPPHKAGSGKAGPGWATERT